MPFKITKKHAEIFLSSLIIIVCALAAFNADSSPAGVISVTALIAFTFVYQRIQTSSSVDLIVVITFIAIVLFLKEVAIVKSPGAFNVITLVACFFAAYLANKVPEKFGLFGKVTGFALLIMGFLWMVHTTTNPYQASDLAGLMIIAAWAMHCVLGSPELIKSLSFQKERK